MSSEQKDPKDWSVAEFETAIANAIAAGDMRFVESALTLMAVVHPREVSLILDTIRVGLALRKVPQ